MRGWQRGVALETIAAAHGPVTVHLDKEAFELGRTEASYIVRKYTDARIETRMKANGDVHIHIV